MNKKIVFFFGAGTECSAFGLPSGAKYTLETMCRKRPKLYDELKEFYQPRLSKEYVEKYRADFMFSKTSHTFRELVCNAATKAYTQEGCKVDKKTEELVNNIKELKEAEEKKTAKRKRQCKELLIELAKISMKQLSSIQMIQRINSSKQKMKKNIHTNQ